MTKGQPFPVEVTWNRSYSLKSGDLCEHLKQELSRDTDLQYGGNNTQAGTEKGPQAAVCNDDRVLFGLHLP